MHVTRQQTALEAMSRHFSTIREVYFPPAAGIDYASIPSCNLAIRDGRLDSLLRKYEVETVEDVLNMPITALLGHNVGQGTIDRLWVSLNLLHFPEPRPYLRRLLGKSPVFLTDLTLPQIYRSHLSEMTLEYLCTATAEELLERFTVAQLLKLHRAVTAYGLPMLVGHLKFEDLLPYYGLDRQKFLELNIPAAKIRALPVHAHNDEDFLASLAALPYKFKLHSTRLPIALLLYDMLLQGLELPTDTSIRIIRDLVSNSEWEIISPIDMLPLTQSGLSRQKGVTRQRVGQVFTKLQRLFTSIPRYEEWESQLVEALANFDEHVHIDNVLEIISSTLGAVDQDLAIILAWIMMERLRYRPWHYDASYYITGARAGTVSRTIQKVSRKRQGKYSHRIRQVMYKAGRPMKATEVLKILQPEFPELDYTSLYNLMNSRLCTRVDVGTFAHPDLKMKPVPKRLSSARTIIMREMGRGNPMSMTELETIIVQERGVDRSWARKNIRDYCVVDAERVLALKS